MSVVTAPAAIDHHGDGGHPPTATGVSNEKLAMWIFLGSECLLFGALIATYLVYKGKSITGPYPEDVYDIPFTSLSSFVLLMSSLTMVLAVTATRRGDMRRSRIWLITTALLGSVFIGGQIYEFTVFHKEGLRLSTNLFGSSFYVLTGFHGAHVTVGILMLLGAAFMSWRGRITRRNWESVEIVGLYWHFVDVIWILIFTVIYLIK
jgi:cytochrome c oxidase subunit 3/cytochrome o ubiquinol oxidase subunit 3